MNESKSLSTFTLAPTSFEELERVSQLLAKSQIVPSAYQNKPANIAVAVMWGQEIGLSPLQALTGIAVINGKGSLYGDAALALIMAHPEFEDIEEKIIGEGDNRVAVCVIKRKGKKPKEWKFSVDDAKAAFLWDTRLKVKSWKNNVEVEIINPSPWFRHQNRMLQMRARGFCMRDTFPDGLRGISIVEEHQGYDQQDIVDATPAKPTNEYMPVETEQTPEPTRQEEAVDAEFVENPDEMSDEEYTEKQCQESSDKFMKEIIDTKTGEVLPAETPELTKKEFVSCSPSCLSLIENKLKSINLPYLEMFNTMGIRKNALAELSFDEGNECLTWIRTFSGR